MPRTFLHVEIEHELKSQLQQLADQDQRILSNYIRKLLTDHVRSVKKVDEASEKIVRKVLKQS